jgi:hypothetical protein
MLFSLASSGLTAGTLYGLQPDMVRKWIGVVGDAGMPGAILLLLGCIFYVEFKKMPAKDEKHEKEIGALREKYERLQDQVLQYRDNAAAKQEERAESRVAAQVQLTETLNRLTKTISDLSTQKGASRNGT